jgi:acetate kinase
MGTRCGDLDAAAVLHMQRRLGMGVEEIERLLNKASGLLGLSGLSADMRDLQRAADAGDAAAQNAIRVFCYRVRKYIGAFWTALGGLDVLVFTAGIGQGSATVRSLSLQGLAGLGIRIDEAKNLAARGFEEVCRVSTDDSQVTVLVVPTDDRRSLRRSRAGPRSHSRSKSRRITSTFRSPTSSGSSVSGTNWCIAGTCRNRVNTLARRR